MKPHERKAIRKPRFTMMFNAVIRDPSLSVGAKATLMLIKSYAGKGIAAYPGAQLMADKLGADRKTVFRWLKELQNAGLIERHRETNRGLQTSNSYVLNDEIIARNMETKKPARDGAKTERRNGAKTEHELYPCTKSPILRFEEPLKAAVG